MFFKKTIYLAILLTLGCGGEPEDTDNNDDTDTDTGTPAEVEGTELIGLDFVLDSSEGFDPVTGTTIRIGFDEASGGGLWFELHAGCNPMEGDFALEDGVVVVDEVAMTDMGCDTALMDQDNWLAAFVTSGPALELAGDTLTLTGSSATLIFLNEEVVTPDQPLVGVLWTVDTYIDGQSASNFNLTEAPTLLLKEDGTLNAFTGCNQGSGNYVATVNEITFSGMAYTRMACADELVASAENYFLSVINNGTSSYHIDANRLTVELGDKGISATTE